MQLKSSLKSGLCFMMISSTCTHTGAQSITLLNDGFFNIYTIWQQFSMEQCVSQNHMAWKGETKLLRYMMRSWSWQRSSRSVRSAELSRSSWVTLNQPTTVSVTTSSSFPLTLSQNMILANCLTEPSPQEYLWHWVLLHRLVINVKVTWGTHRQSFR